MPSPLEGLIKPQRLWPVPTSYWVGGSDLDKEGSFRWLDDSPISRELKNIFSDENNEQCDFLFINDSGWLGCRPGNGFASRRAYKWVNNYP